MVLSLSFLVKPEPFGDTYFSGARDVDASFAAFVSLGMPIAAVCVNAYFDWEHMHVI
jgi:hypothetical protein